MSDHQQNKQQQFWTSLRQFTEARIGLGHAGGSVTTEHHLAFQFAHACAQDAVNRPLDWQIVIDGLTDSGVDLVQITSQAKDRPEYLKRPDLGRKLSEESKTALQEHSKKLKTQDDVVIVIADGLSTTAIEQQAAALTKQVLTLFAKHELTCRTVCLADQSRVALGDGVAEQLGAQHLVVIVGERPGLSSPNSLGMYYCFNAKVGYTDAERNCISNIRPGGQSIEQASHRLMWLILEADKLKLSGVRLKDGSDNDQIAHESTANFLLPRVD